MGALGTLLLYGIYATLVAISIIFFRLSIGSKSRFLKIIYIVVAILSFSLLTYWIIETHQKNRQRELEHVGTYYLTKYPNCNNCVVVLSSDNTYKVLNGDSVIEKSNWHYKSGDDYFIVYMDNDKGQLGSGKFSYDSSDNGLDIKK